MSKIVEWFSEQGLINAAERSTFLERAREYARDQLRKKMIYVTNYNEDTIMAHILHTAYMLL